VLSTDKKDVNFQMLWSLNENIRMDVCY